MKLATLFWLQVKLAMLFWLQKKLPHAVLDVDSAGNAGDEDGHAVFAVDSAGNAGDEDGHAVLAVDSAGNAGDEDGHAVLAVVYAGNPFQTLSESTDIFTQLSKFNSHYILQICKTKILHNIYLA